MPVARHARSVCILSVLLAASASNAAPTLDGQITPADGYLLLTEVGFARPFLGGSATTSDQVAESSTFSWWDGIGNRNVSGPDNRADIINVYVAFDATHLYLGLTGPTAPFNSFGQPDPAFSNDIGDLYLALDLNGGLTPAPGAKLRATDSHNSFAAKAVDFLGWQPTHFIGVQYVDNGGGGGGWANLERAVTHAVLAAEGQSLGNGGFDWAAAINPAASYDTHNNNAGEFEIKIPWALLGLSGPPDASNPLRMAAYITQNFGNFDAYDSAPGIGNNIVHEQIGDCPGDPDTGGQLGACDPGSFANSGPGSNFVADLNFDPGRLDGIDTIEEYFSVVVPEPTTLGLAALAGLFGFRRRAR